MKKIILTTIAALFVIGSMPLDAMARGGHGGGGHFHGGGDRHRDWRHHDHDRGWGDGYAGAAIGAAAGLGLGYAAGSYAAGGTHGSCNVYARNAANSSTSGGGADWTNEYNAAYNDCRNGD